jgi:hypothetical protein
MLALMHVTACLLRRHMAERKKSNSTSLLNISPNNKSVARIEKQERKTPVSRVIVDTPIVEVPHPISTQPVGGPAIEITSIGSEAPKSIVLIGNPLVAQIVANTHVSRQSSGVAATIPKPPTPPGDKDFEGWQNIVSSDHT